jgi:polar amino acid transport system substrate-binding protein
MTRTTSVVELLAVAALVTGVAGCASTSDNAQRTALAALATPAPTTAAAATPTPSAHCTDPTASLRPSSGPIPAGSFMDRIRQRGRLIAGVDQNTLLLGYLRPSTGRIEGFEVDILREVARAIFDDPSRIELRAVTTDQRLPLVRSGTVDVVADAVTINCGRLRQVAFSTVYFDASQRLLVPSSSRARRLADLAGHRVCATKGSTSLQRIASDPAHPIPYPVAQRTDCLVALQQGAVDAITGDDPFLLGYRAQDPNTKLIGPPLEEEPYGMAIDKSHPDFVRFVNGVLERIRGDGTWRRLYRRWFGAVAPAATPPSPRYEG